jgi:hypothetical protein
MSDGLVWCSQQITNTTPMMPHTISPSPSPHVHVSGLHWKHRQNFRKAVQLGGHQDETSLYLQAKMAFVSGQASEAINHFMQLLELVPLHHGNNEYGLLLWNMVCFALQTTALHTHSVSLTLICCNTNRAITQQERGIF